MYRNTLKKDQNVKDKMTNSAKRESETDMNKCFRYLSDREFFGKNLGQ